MITDTSPEECARIVRQNLGLGHMPLDLTDVCKKLNLEIVEENLGASGKAAGVLVRSGNRGIILINKNIHYEQRKRFTLGHEIGHFCIPSHTLNQYECVLSDIETFNTNKAHETEANRFSSELLLTSVKAKEILRVKELSIPVTSQVAYDFGMSLTATALKLVKQSEHDACVLILSNGTFIKWHCESMLFNRRWQLKRNGLPIPLATVQKSKADLREWIYGDNLSDVQEVWLEHVLIGDQMVLTLLTIPINGSYEDDYDDDEY